MNIFDLVMNNDFAGIQNNAWDKDTLNMRDNTGMTPLMIAAESGFDHVVTALKEKGADVHIADNRGRKAVDYAALHGHGLIILLLVEGGCGG
jgi:ankyrin repeat protein